ncbi:MAG TPA: hypothetical protein VFN97_21050 [Actinospica sp.]|nr:hypothetical protein [Actinospica sp.]
MIDPPRRLAAALAGVGAVLCVLGWYQISGQPTVAQQLPYLASATIPGAALLAVGLALALRDLQPRSAPRGEDGPVSGPTPFRRTGLWRLPDGRYLHAADCPLLDGRPDLLPVPAPEPGDKSEPGVQTEPDGEPTLRPCPLCHAGAED